MRKRVSPGVILGAIAVVLGLTGTAAAGSLITSAKIKDGTIQGRDIHRGTIAADKLSASVRQQLAKANFAAVKGEKGEKGDPGPTLQGSAPQKGDKGDAGLDSDQPRAVSADALRGFTLAPKGDNDDATANGTVDFATPPVAPTLGTKSLHFKSDTGKPVVVYAPLPSGYNGATGPRPLLAELTKVSYGSLIHSQPQNALDVGFQFEVVKSKATAFTSGYTTVVYEPYQNGSSETLDEWHRHSVDTGLVWSTKALPSDDCTQAVPCPFAQFVSENPQAEVLTAKLRIGQNSGQGWSGFEGYVDDVSFGFGPVTRYDFGG
jgi:hypothetical protein